MNRNVTLAIAAIVAATALTAIPFAIPQQALAGGYGHRHHNSNSISVDQQIDQANLCNSSSSRTTPGNATVLAGTPGTVTCFNIGSNDANVR